MTTSGVTPQTAPGPAPGAGANGAATRLETIRPHLPREFVARLVEDVVVGSNAGTTPIHAPVTGEVIVELPQSAPGDVRLAFQKARAAQPAWAARPVGERAAVLRRLHDLLFDNEPHLLNLVQIETGKARLHAYEELAGAAAALRHYAAAAPGYLKTRRRAGILPGLTKVSEVRHPKGVVGLITPWNYPLALVVMDIAPALVAGNAVVHKPDNATTLTALYLRQFAVRAGLPQDAWQIVTGEGPVTGPAVVDHADYVAFTGSTRTGRQVAQQAAGRLIGCSLELGGKNSMIVFDDADLEKAVQGALRGCFSSAGQLCVSFERIYVHYSLHDQFLERFVTETKALRLGGGLDYGADVGSLASTRQLESVTLHVEDARAKGAKVLAGGRRRPDVGSLFYEPTILSGVTAAMNVYAQETFGPVVSVFGFKNEAEVLEAANDTVYGLNAAVWTRDAKRAREAALRLHSGMVNVNEAYGAAFGSVAAAIGGMGDSGLGRRNGAEGIHRYTELQTIARQTVLPLAPWFGESPERYTKQLTFSLRLLKRLGLK
ncbi:succinate-semialdehyde dehydrogenase (NADP(+)) [Actinocrinis puniceicyclus]|uniref:succinate-semialdehyde dehydrogenase (NADP(+)) n=1 Tax=Actinocrinis puniceicyclus TaxID=977794 RepID=A0A8J8B9C7_9ACTN|nr:succinic semialdehyde dehydrogenase [Actinocrinis puniceicyclus]MBS2961702.1 succinate-semialdehyde dehydrogenase (NADP(+)) [Actinocrinis puniceicyclus]